MLSTQAAKGRLGVKVSEQRREEARVAVQQGQKYIQRESAGSQERSQGVVPSRASWDLKRIRSLLSFSGSKAVRFKREAPCQRNALLRDGKGRGKVMGDDGQVGEATVRYD